MSRRGALPHSWGRSVVGTIQTLMSRMLRLDFQLDCINYSLPNFRNADLDLKTFQRLQVSAEEHWSDCTSHGHGGESS